MNDGFSGSALIAAIIKYGFAAVLGMIGAALLYMVLPPLTPDGKFDRREFALRLFAAGVVSTLFGDWVISLLMDYTPRLQAQNHAGAAYMMVGAPGWWISRAIALWLQNRRGKDIQQIVHDVRKRK